MPPFGVVPYTPFELRNNFMLPHLCTSPGLIGWCAWLVFGSTQLAPVRSIGGLSMTTSVSHASWVGSMGGLLVLKRGNGWSMLLDGRGLVARDALMARCGRCGAHCVRGAVCRAGAVIIACL